MAQQYRPRHRTQLQRPVTGQYDCGPRTLQHAADFATKGNRDIGVARMRMLMGRPGAQPTNIWNSDEAFSHLGLAYARHAGVEWSVATDALRHGKGLQICVVYGVVNKLQPSRSGDRGFNGGHSIYIQELKRRRGDRKLVTLSFDSLFDGRRPEIPSNAAHWVLLSTYRRACQAFAGREGLWWGGVIPPNRRVSGPGDPGEDEPDSELDEQAPIDPDATAVEGEMLPPGSTGEDLEEVDELDDDELEEVDEDEEVE